MRCYRPSMRLTLLVVACALVAACSVPLAPGPASRQWGYLPSGGGQSGGGELGSGDDASDAAPEGGDGGLE